MSHEGLLLVLYQGPRLYSASLQWSPVKSDDETLKKPDLSAQSATLVFGAILVVSGNATSWRVDGLRQAAIRTGLSVQIPAQPAHSEESVEELRRGRPSVTTDSALGWLSHLYILKLAPRISTSAYETVLILEDDVDWDIAIPQEASLIARAIQHLTARNTSDPDSSPYGTNWDILWLGHCGDRFPMDKKSESIRDPTLPRPVAAPDPEPRDTQSARVHPRCAPLLGSHLLIRLCYATARSAEAARVNDGSAAEDEAFDVKLSRACHDGLLDCMTVTPELFRHERIARQPRSEVGAADGVEEVQNVMATWNIRYSARCNSDVGDEHLVQCVDERAIRAFQVWMESEQGKKYFELMNKYPV